MELVTHCVSACHQPQNGIPIVAVASLVHRLVCNMALSSGGELDSFSWLAESLKFIVLTTLMSALFALS
jgi:hypothetical protein